MVNCFFCDIKQEENNGIFCESELFFARFTDFPVNEGHVEIVPKKHIASFFDLTKSELNLQSYEF